MGHIESIRLDHWNDLNGEPCKVEVTVSAAEVKYRAGQTVERVFRVDDRALLERVETSILEDSYAGRCVFQFDEDLLAFKESQGIFGW